MKKTAGPGGFPEFQKTLILKIMLILVQTVLESKRGRRSTLPWHQKEDRDIRRKL